MSSEQKVEPTNCCVCGIEFFDKAVKSPVVMEGIPMGYECEDCREVMNEWEEEDFDSVFDDDDF